MSTLQRAVAPRKATTWNLALNVVLTITFGTLQVLAALALDGWLSWALFAIAGWNAMRLVLIMVGVSNIAAEALNAERARAAGRQAFR